MRRLPVAIAVSLLSHASAVAWVAQDRGSVAAPKNTLDAAVAAPPAAAPVEPMAVTLFNVRDVALPAAEHTHGRAAITVGPTRGEPTGGEPTRGEATRGEPAASTDAPVREPAPGNPVRSSWMTMRPPEPPAVTGPSSGFIERFLARSKPVPPPPDIPGERIAEQLADVRKRRRDAERHHPDEAGALLLEAVALAAQREAEELKPKGGGTYQADKETFTARVDRDGKVHIEDKRERLDAQDAMMLRRGIDPYARNKLAMLDRTRDQRAALGERHHREQLARAARLAQGNIERLWATTRDAAARRIALFELWDDCAETGSEEMVAAGAAARAVVVGAIRARLRGDEAYTAAELAQLNARRRSSAVFAPYE